MKTSRLLSLCFFLASIVLGCSNAYSQANMTLVSSTNFSVLGAEDNSFCSISSVNDFGGVLIPEITIGEDFTLTPGVESSYSEGDFLSGMHYGISYDSRRLDTLRMADDKGDWGIVFSSGKKNILTTSTLLNYKVRGLKNGGKYKVVIEYCNPHSKDYMDLNSTLNKKSRVEGAPYMNFEYNANFKVGVNTNYLDGVDVMVSPSSSEIQTITINSPSNVSSTLGLITDGTLNVRILTRTFVEYSALKINSIKVYAELDPVIVGKHSDCVGGKDVILKLSDTYQDCKYQWYKNGINIPGATRSSYIYTTGYIEEDYVFTCDIITPSSDKIMSRPFTFSDKSCYVGDDGIPTDEKLIWQDDFGTFTDKGHYWVWDYTDINNPIKVEKTTSDGWTYKLSYSIPGAMYNSMPGTGVGDYSVAANVTSQFDGATSGTMWTWQAKTFSGVTPQSYGREYAPDHSESLENAPEGYGAMLFLDCGNEPNEVIYQRTISGLCNKDIVAKCYISTWSTSDSPVQIMIRVTDLNSGESNTSDIVKCGIQKKLVNYYDAQTAWKEVSVPIQLTGSDLKLEIISAAGGVEYNNTGNDLLLDDIQLWSYSVPNVDLSFEKDDLVKNTITCSGDEIQLFTNNSKMIGNYYRNDARFIYQYTLENPYDNKSWKTIPESGFSESLSLAGLLLNLNQLEPGDNIYFRVVLLSKEQLEALGLDYVYSPNGPCSAYSVSNPIKATVKCPTCTSPKQDVKIVADRVASDKKDGVDVIELCYGESVTLSQEENITPDVSDLTDSDFEGYSMAWYEGTLDAMVDGTIVINSVIDPKVVEYNDETLAGTEMPIYLYAVDASYPTGPCGSIDTVFIRFNKIPTAKFNKSKIEVKEGKEDDELDLTMTEGSMSDFEITWWFGEDSLKSNLVGTDLDMPVFLKELKSGDSGMYSYMLVDKATGCNSKINNMEIVVTPATGIESLSADDNTLVNVYTNSGALIKANVNKSKALDGLQEGVYVVGDKKVIKTLE